MKKITLAIFIFAAILAAGSVAASSKSDIVYPVKELGGCRNESGCRAYCDIPANLRSCVDFADKHNLMSAGEIEQAKKFVAAGGQGPGGCTSQESCESYCNDIAHIDECLAFGEENDLLPPEELAEAKKVQAALKRGTKLPGGCRSKAACDSFCGDPVHFEECIVFAEAAGFIPENELEEARKVLQAIKKGAVPPPCRGKDECDRYCSDPANFEVCLPFAEAAGLIEPDELEEAKQALAAIKKGVKPPKCRGRAECDEYCREPAHLEECLTFAEAAGFISKEEAQMARKTGGVGPGGCRGKDECDEYCADPAHGEECFNFAKEHGLLSEDDLERIEEGREQILGALEQAPEPVLECITAALGQKTIDELKAGTGMPNEAMGGKIQTCFTEMMRGETEFMPGSEFEGSEDFKGEPDFEDEPQSLLEKAASFLANTLSGLKNLVK